MRRPVRSLAVAAVLIVGTALFGDPAQAGAVPATSRTLSAPDLGLAVPPSSGEDLPAPLGTGLSTFFDIELRNYGAQAAARLTITLPTGLVLGPSGVGRYANESGFLSGALLPSAIGCSPAGANTLSCDAGPVAAATTADPPIIEIELQATSAGVPGTARTFTVGVAPTSGTDGNNANDVVQGAVEFTGIADLDFAITPPAAAVPVGRSATLTLSVTNHGPQPADETIAISMLQFATHFGITSFDGNTTPPGGVPLARASARRAALANVARAAGAHARSGSSRGGSVSRAAIEPPADGGLFWFIGTLAPGSTATAHLTVIAKAVGSEQLALIAGSNAADTGCVAAADPCLPALAALTAAPAITTAYVASTRWRGAVFINGLVKQTAGTGLIRSANRTVYLQRFLDGRWQNMVARPTSLSGQLFIGFMQTRVVQYRLYVVASPAARAAPSGVTFR